MDLGSENGIDMTHISLAHGNGGSFMRQLIKDVFASCLANPMLDTNADAAILTGLTGELMMSVDGFTVKPLEFPGGDIGSLAVHGTVNDIAVSGAIPMYLSVSAIIEEGLAVDKLTRIIQSMANAAECAGVRVVCGDTKVVPRGEGSELFLTTTGIGVRQRGVELGVNQIQNGDCILVSGSVGDHGAAIMLAREQFGLQGQLVSDSASVLPLCHDLYDLPGLRFMRDPTRGGLATVLHEIQQASAMGIRIQQTQIPVRDPVSSVCEILGYDPLFLACEGRVVAVVAPHDAEQALTRWRNSALGGDAAIIGHIEKGLAAVVMETEIGGQRVLEELEDDPLPRIC